MRVQLQGQALRLRIDEDELARLLDGAVVTNATHWPDASVTRQQVTLGAHDHWQGGTDGWCVTLADSAVRDLAERLPTRDGVHIELEVPDASPLQILFDIDTRDSARRRLPKHAKPL